MSEVAIDFGASNTVIARFDQERGLAQTLRIPEVGRELRYRLTPECEQHSVWTIPSLIYYGEQEQLIGEQVIARGFAFHAGAIRWMKRGVLQCNSRRKRTAQGLKSAAEAGEDFLRAVLRRAAPQISLTEDEFTFTVPVEAFETFEEWIRRVAESTGIRKFRVLDEPTACVFGYREAVRQDERFLVFDFGAGTLDVSVVRLDLQEPSGRKAVQLGRAGCDLGGMDIDHWLAAKYFSRQELSAVVRRDFDNRLLCEAEAAKIALSDPMQSKAEMCYTAAGAQSPQGVKISWKRNCRKCDGRAPELQADEACLGCLLNKKNFRKQIEETLDRALENAAIKAGVRRSDLTRVLVTGGTSLIPAVRQLLRAKFGEKVELDHPFDCVARGACRNVVTPILQHDYAIESYNHEQKRFEFKPLFKAGLEYPTQPSAVRYWSNGSVDGQTRVGLRIYELSRIKRSAPDSLRFDAKGRILAAEHAVSEFEHVCLNPDNPSFLVADPPIKRERDRQRFLCAFAIDGDRRLLVTAYDQLSGKQLLFEHPVTRL